MSKILIIRFSSIGDIVLTTPVIRCIKQQIKNAELHYVTKEAFYPILEHNPFIDKIHSFKKDVSEIYPILIAEKFDFVIDLHNNLRSLRLKQKLKVPSFSFNKLNTRKFLAVNLKMTSLLPAKHIVQRYLKAAEPIGAKDDGKGLDYFISESDKVQLTNYDQLKTFTHFIALVIGGSYFTKKIPMNKLVEIIQQSKLPIVLLGGKEDRGEANQLTQKFPQIINTCGNLTINQSASIIQQAEWVISSDTGLMHIAAAFHKKIISVWGNTIPEFGMGPYLPNSENKIVEIKKLSCRPCSKLGYKKCPKGHFKCMNDLDFSFIESLQ